MDITTQTFKKNARQALKNTNLQTAMQRATGVFLSRRKAAVEEFEDFEALREYCGAVKTHTVAHLDHYLEQLVTSLEHLGVHVHFAADGDEANQIITTIAQENNVRTVAKSKSMVSEEIHLNKALESANVTPIETDLGEYILQISNDTPSHLIGPAIHRTREDITQLFHEKLGVSLDASIPDLTAAARKKLREAFLNADMGITGVNFAVAETGTLVMVENEGNIRMCNSLPRVHVALMGMEKLIPRLRDLPAFLTALPRSATGQRSTSYVSMISGPRREGDSEGPEAVHVVIVDNGRSSVLADPKLREALRCIRCGACLNACPVYQNIGGHAYGWVYGGPIGSILDPGLLSLNQTKNLPNASSLCGACGEVCPVKIPIPELLIEHRKRAVSQGLSPFGERRGIGAFEFIAKRPGLWDNATNLGRPMARFFARDDYMQWNEGRWMPAMREWLKERDFPAPAKTSFKTLWRKELKEK